MLSAIWELSQSPADRELKAVAQRTKSAYPPRKVGNPLFKCTEDADVGLCRFSCIVKRNGHFQGATNLI